MVKKFVTGNINRMEKDVIEINYTNKDVIKDKGYLVRVSTSPLDTDINKPVAAGEIKEFLVKTKAHWPFPKANHKELVHPKTSKDKIYMVFFVNSKHIKDKDYGVPYLNIEKTVKENEIDKSGLKNVYVVMGYDALSLLYSGLLTRKALTWDDMQRHLFASVIPWPREALFNLEEKVVHVIEFTGTNQEVNSKMAPLRTFPFFSVLECPESEVHIFEGCERTVI